MIYNINGNYLYVSRHLFQNNNGEIETLLDDEDERMPSKQLLPV